MKERLMYLFTKTPLHLGAGSSVGAIDLPVMRERHTRYPFIPGSSLKGVLADLWEKTLESWKEDKPPVYTRCDEALWLFGAEDASKAASGSLLVGEARLLAFPLRSAKNGFAWITSPLALGRYFRDSHQDIPLPVPSGAETCFASPDLVLKNTDKENVVLEEYAFAVQGEVPQEIIQAMEAIFSDDLVWNQVAKHLVILSDELFSFFVENSCQVTTRIKIDDFTGTAAQGALFNQENVPSESLFYAPLGGEKGRGRQFAVETPKEPEDVLTALETKLEETGRVLQIGGDGSTGHGWCSVSLGEVLNRA